MQDSNITYKVTATGVKEVEAKFRALNATIQKMNFNANGTVTASGKLTSQLGQQGNATDRVSKATDRASRSQQGYFAHIAKTTVQSALINQLFLQFVDVAGQAIKQVDLMQNFPATMASMGQSTADANVALQSLRDYIGQIGGNLGDATSYVTRFTGATGNVKAATAIFVGLNNALIAGDSSMEEQRQSVIQFAQALERGKPDLREWRNLTQNMSFQLQQVAKEMGYVNANALGEALTNGEESMASFVTALTRLSTGTGPIAQQALARMNGVQFAFNVLKNTFVQGLAAIINAFGRANIVSFFRFITQVVQVLTGWVVTLINWLGALVNFISGLFGGGKIFKGVEGDVQGVGAALGDAAGGAGDLSDGLDDAGGSAGKLNKELNKSLAAFDKMNVLPDKGGNDGSGGGGGGGGSGGGAGGGGFDPSQLGDLGDIFDGLGGKMEEISKWAKIFAGILAGIAGIKLAQGLFNQMNGLIKTFDETRKNAQRAKDALGKLKDAFKGVGDEADKTGEKTGKSFGEKIAGGLGKASGKLSSAITGFVGGLAGAIGGALAPALGGLATTVATAIGGALAAGAAALGVSVGVFVAIIAAVVLVIAGLIYVIWRNWDTIWGWIKDSASTAWQFIQTAWDGITEFFVNLWHGIYDVFMDAWTWLQEWGLTVLAVIFWPFTLLLALVINIVAGVYGAFVWLWNVISALWSGAYNWFKVNVWDRIVEVFSKVTEWFAEKFTQAWNGIVAIWTVVSEWFRINVWDRIVAIFTGVANWFKERFSLAWEGIKLIFSPAFTWFKTDVWDKITSVFSGVATWFGNTFKAAYDRVTSVFSGLWSWFKSNVWDRIVSVFSSIGTHVADAIGGAFRGVINAVLGAAERIINGFFGTLNGAIGTINKIPGVNIRPIPTVSLPRLARGGVVEQATTALIGEEGAEAVVPLENNTEWINKLAAKINSATGGSGQPVEIVVQIGEERIASTVIDLINEKTQMSGRNTILV